MTIPNSIGIMQGRLSPPQDGRFQFFPVDWPAEYAVARDLGFDHVQWFLDRDHPNHDPVKDIWLNPTVLDQIDAARSVVPISSVDCGTYGMFGAEVAITLEQFPLLLPALAERLSTGVVSIALLEKNAPKTEHEKSETRETLIKLLKIAQPLHLRLALETEMPAPELIEFIDSLQSDAVGVGYDIGNCTSYGFDCPADIRLLGSRIIEVHCKDRQQGKSQSMLLGTGDADYDGLFAALREINYTGAITLQAWRGDDYLADARQQLEFVKEKLHTIYG